MGPILRLVGFEPTTPQSQAEHSAASRGKQINLSIDSIDTKMKYSYKCDEIDTLVVVFL